MNNFNLDKNIPNRHHHNYSKRSSIKHQVDMSSTVVPTNRITIAMNSASMATTKATFGILLLMSSLTLVSTVATTPSLGLSIPKRSLGYVYKTSSAPRSSLVTLTVYMDLTCPDSQAAFPTLTKLADSLKEHNFELVFRSFSLPYHRNSHVINSALHIVDELAGSAKVYPFIGAVYDNLKLLVPEATSDMTDTDIIVNILAPIVYTSTGIKGDRFVTEISNNSKYDLAARLDFKYGCTRGVYGTPTFMLNDVVVDGATPTWSVKQWEDLIVPLL